jgi:hypothetical protein
MGIATWVLVAGVLAAGATMQEEDDCIEDALALAIHGSAWPTEQEEKVNARQDARKPADGYTGGPGDTVSEEETDTDPPPVTNTPAKTETTKNPEQTSTPVKPEPSKNPEQTNTTIKPEATKKPVQTNTTVKTETTTAKTPEQTSTPVRKETSKNPEQTSTTVKAEGTKNPEQTSTSTPTPVKAKPEKIPTTSNQTMETVVGLEILGPVQVLVSEMELGVPSTTNETVYTPFESVHIVIPAGAWVARADRGLAPLTLTIFVLPPGTGSPRTACGAALDLGPRDQRLALPISIALPCTTPTQAGVFRLNTTSGRWDADTPMPVQQEGTVWGGTQSLGVHSALAMPGEEAPVTLGSSGSPRVGIALGASFGALGLVACMLGTVFSVRRKHAKGENPARVSPSVGTELCFAAEV